ncbi:MAG: pilus assembly protein TadG-related protein [Firmicutes bacterium]|nr:pilus assembly protein TadG-related protein [Bacillota bacterium]
MLLKRKAGAAGACGYEGSRMFLLAVKEEKGVAALLIALLLPVILLFFALALDIAGLVLVKRQVQATADAAALAGASRFEVYGEYQGGIFVPVFEIQPEAADEADKAVVLNADNFNFADRDISLTWSHDGIYTDMFAVTMEVEAPTLLFHSIYSLFDSNYDKNKFHFYIGAEVKIQP